MSTIDYQDTEIFMSAMTQFWIGFAIDVPFRILICVIVKSAKIVKNYEGKYLAFSLNIQPNELKKYSRTPIKLINENLSQENANLPNCDDLIKSNGLIESVSPLTFVEQSIVEKTFDMSSNDIKKDSPLRLPRLNKSPQLGDFLRNYDDFLMNINQANYVEEDPYLGKDLSGEEANSPYFSVNVKRKLSDEETIASHNGSSEEELILYPENFPSTPRPSRCAVFQSPSPKKNNSPDKRKATSSKGLKLKLHSCEKSKVRPDLSPMKTPENDSHSFFDSLLEIAGEYNEPEIVDYDCKLQNSCGKSDLGNTYSDYKDKTAATINIDESMPESQFNTTACIEIIDSLQLSSCKNKYNKHTDNLNHSRSKENEFSHVPEPDFAGSMSDERRVRDPVSKPPVFNRRRTSPDITSQVLEEIRPTNSSPKPPIYNQRRSSIEFGTPVSEDPRTSESSPKPPSLRGRKLRKGSDRDQLRNAGELLVSDRNSIDNPDILQRRRSKEEIGRPPRVPSPARSDSETFY